MTELITQTDERAGLPSASSMDRLYHCPGSRAAQLGLPELPPKQVTTDGTEIHGALETGDHEDLEVDAKEIAANITRVEEAEVAKWAEDFGVRHWECHREGGEQQRYWIRNRVTLEPIASARPDVLFVSKSPDLSAAALVINYKTGYKDQAPSERNWQTKTEVISSWHEYAHVERFRGAILASRLSTKFDYADYELDDLKRVESELRHIVWRSEQPDAPRVPGPHCTYCRAQGFCKEAAAYSLIPHVDVPVTKKKDEFNIVQAVQAMTPAELGFMYQRKPTVESIYEQIENRLKNLPAAELAKAGYKLVDGITTYPIPAESVIDCFTKLSPLLTDEERVRCINIVRGRADAIVAEKKGISKESAKALVIETLGLAPKEGNKRLKAL